MIRKDKQDLANELNDVKVQNKKLLSEISSIRGILDNLIYHREHNSNNNYQLECDLKEANLRISTYINMLTKERQEKFNYISAFKNVLKKYS